MANLIKEAFKAVKKDIFTLRDRIEETKTFVKELKKELSKVNTEKLEKKLEKKFTKLEEKITSIRDSLDVTNLEKDLNQRIDNSNELTEEKLMKELSQLKRRLTLLEKKKTPKAPLYKAEKETLEEAPEPAEEPWEEDDNGKKKKGFFSKIIDFLAEEED